MKIDDKIISYEAAGNTRKLSPAGADRIEKEKISSENQVSEQKLLGADAIVHLSQAGREAKAIREFLDSLPDVRSDKVSLISEKIASGTYSLNYEGVAGKVVDAFLEELL